ncbi:MAG: hypothetical protein KDA28_11795, partial [Phycisphaerales bacterium]|nr:hypothetical protein [Phycisphaerales bacterium]
PLVAAATMLGDPRLTTDEERIPELSRLANSMRFVKQLSGSHANGFMYASRRARDGVRLSLWQQEMRPEVTALGLLAQVEVLRSIESIR